MKKTCKKCGQSFPATKEYFYRDARNRDGLKTACRPCELQKDRERRRTGAKKKRPRNAHTRAQDVQYLLQHRTRRKQQIQEIKLLLGCCVCGYNTCARSLHFHHLDGDTKEENIAYLRNGESVAKIGNELSKCVVMCANCHGELHDGLLVLDVEPISLEWVNAILTNKKPYEDYSP